MKQHRKQYRLGVEEGGMELGRTVAYLNLSHSVVKEIAKVHY